MKDIYFMAQTIINKVLVIAAEISVPPKSNGDKIRNMNDEELADWLTDGHDNCDLCQHGTCRPQFECEKGVLQWLKQEVILNENRRTESNP